MRQRTRSEQGFTLIEAIIAIVVLGIAVPVVVVLLRSAGLQSAKAERLSQATLMAQGKMDQVIADKKARGYAYVCSLFAEDPDHYDDEPSPGYTRAVTATDDTLEGVAYKEVTVTVASDDAQFPPVPLRTWLTDNPF